MNHNQSDLRFGFGKNWSSFLAVLNDERIVEAEASLKTMLRVDSLAGKSLVDVGSGSGLFSLAAVRLGAARVHSFDYDLDSVACAHELKRRYFAQADHWTIEQGDVLDADYVRQLGKWDVVYSWGVLHHTGDMWRALANVEAIVGSRGKLFIAIYNDQGGLSQRWRAVKRLYNRNTLSRGLVSALFIPYFFLRGLAADFVRMKDPTARFREYKKSRGMSLTHDWFDWLGGYPFEVARPEQIFDFYHARDFELLCLKTAGAGWGNNEFVFRRKSES